MKKNVFLIAASDIGFGEVITHQVIETNKRVIRCADRGLKGRVGNEKEMSDLLLTDVQFVCLRMLSELRDWVTCNVYTDFHRNVHDFYRCMRNWAWYSYHTVK